jgi:hypothetical protein
MSLLTQASLVLTPTSYKANKLYSVVPSSGSGDMTTTRATTATRINSSGLVENVATGIPRVDYTGGVANILLEPQRTNRLLNSATVVTQTITTTAVDNTLSFYGTGTITLSGTFSGSLVGTGISNRVSLTFTPTVGNLVLTVSGTCTNGQLETGSYATSYIPTVASTVTRNADLMALNNIYTNNFITSAGGTWFVELDNNVLLVRDGFSYGIFINSSSTANGNGFNIRHSTTNLLVRLRINKTTLGVDTALYTTLTNNIKVAIKWNETTADVFVNGIKVVSATAFTTTNMEFLNGTAQEVPKYIKSMILFPTPLTDAECISLTTL